jgi:hypothetical protein
MRVLLLLAALGAFAIACVHGYLGWNEVNRILSESNLHPTVARTLFGTWNFLLVLMLASSVAFATAAQTTRASHASVTVLGLAFAAFGLVWSLVVFRPFTPVLLTFAPHLPFTLPVGLLALLGLWVKSRQMAH